MYLRSVSPIISNSFFLFGARGTGKSSFLRGFFPTQKVLWLDLLDEERFHRYVVAPSSFRDEILAAKGSVDWVVVDEIQRVPGLLNYVHLLIESEGLKFALTGSSARKLRRGSANLLAGRAFLNHLHPLTHRELGNDFDLADVLRWGTLPKIQVEREENARKAYLQAYVGVYLKSEIQEGQAVRNLEPFLKFLEISAQCNGQILNYSRIARDAGIRDPKAVERYFQILDDTLIGFHLPPFHRSVRKRQTRQSKFYYFDLGVKAALENLRSSPLVAGTYSFGRAFEHFFVLECIRLNDYGREEHRFSYLRTKDDLEVDLIVERPGKPLLLIEIKSAETIDARDAARYKAVRADLAPCEFWIVSNVPVPSKLDDNGWVLPWKDALDRLYPERTPEKAREKMTGPFVL